MTDLARLQGEDVEQAWFKTAPQPSGRRRPGFSMVEVLIAIAVIVILISIAVLGFRSLEGTGRQKQTMSTLASAEGMLKELASAGAAARLEGPDDFVPAPIFKTGATAAPIDTPGDVNPGKPGRDTAINDMKPVMAVLLAVPNNKKAVDGMPSEALVKPKPTTDGTPPVPYAPPRLADAWGNPLLLVPSKGLNGVELGDEPLTAPITSPSKRPFWASAGPDGDFTKGDDNLYSFDK